jgi:tetratricopeptide (TPR) repeat protein/capsular polysaccharide biosynthesis protein
MERENSIAAIKSYLAERYWQEAINLCRQELKLRPNDVDLYNLLAKALVGRGNWDKAIATYQKSLEYEPKQPQIYCELGQVYSFLQQDNRARVCYTEAVAQQPEDFNALYSLALVSHKLGDWQGALAAYQRTIELDPNNAGVYFNLGVLFDRRGQLDKAVKHYRRSIELSPEFNTYNNLAGVFAKQTKFERAIQTYQKGLALNPVSEALHNNLGQAFLQQEKSDLALKSFRTAIAIEPEMAAAHHNIGRVWMMHGSYNNAIQSFQRTIILDPSNIWAYSDGAMALWTVGDLELAVKYFRKAISLQPSFVEAYCQRARQIGSDDRDLLNRVKISCAKFLEALTTEAKLSKVYRYLAQTCLRLGNVLFEYGAYAQAEPYYQKALQIEPERVDLYLRLGNTLAKQRRYEGAIAIYQIGLSLQPNRRQLLFQLAKVYEKLRLFDRAVDCYEKILHLQDVELQEGETIDTTAFTPTETKIFPNLPQGIYPTTVAWYEQYREKVGGEKCSYIEVNWGKKGKKTAKKTKSSSQIILPKPIGEADPECGGVTCQSCMSRLMQLFEPIQVGDGAYVCPPNSHWEIEPANTFVVSIPEGTAWIAPQKNQWQICNAIAVYTPDRYLLSDLSRFYPWYLPGCQRHDRARHEIFKIEELPPVEKINGTVALLSSLSGNFYYHWLIDVIPRFGLLQRAGMDLAEIDWFVINGANSPFQKESLAMLGIPPEKLIDSDSHPHIQATKLIVPSFPGYLDWIPKGTIDFLRESFLPATPPKLDRYPERIYISRAKANHRQVLNEPEIIDYLQRQGFVAVRLESLSFAEQIAHFAAAKVIVAPHGGGLTNLVFCQKGTKVVEFFSPNYLRTDYWMVSQLLGLRHYYLVGRSFDCYPLRQLMYQSALTEDISIDLNSLEAILKVAIG